MAAPPLCRLSHYPRHPVMGGSVQAKPELGSVTDRRILLELLKTPATLWLVEAALPPLTALDRGRQVASTKAPKTTGVQETTVEVIRRRHKQHDAEHAVFLTTTQYQKAT